MSEKINTKHEVKVTFDSMINHALDSTLSNKPLFIGGHTGQGKSEGAKLVSQIFPFIANGVIKNDGIEAFFNGYAIGKLIHENVKKQFKEDEIKNLNFEIKSKYFYINMPQLMKGDDALPITIKKEVLLKPEYEYTISEFDEFTLVGINKDGDREHVRFNEKTSEGKYFISEVYYAPNKVLEEIIKSTHLKVKDNTVIVNIPFLLLDEFNRADRDVLQTFVTQILEKVVYGYEMPKYTQYILTGNNGFEGDDAYEGVDLDPAMKARMNTVILKQDSTEFIKYLARTDAHPAIVQTLRTYPDFLTISGEDGESITNPRMWKNLSNSIKTVFSFADSKINIDLESMDIEDRRTPYLKNYIDNRNETELYIHRILTSLPDELHHTLKSMIFDKGQSITFDEILSGKFIDMIKDENVHTKYIMAQRCVYVLKSEITLSRSQMSKKYKTFIDKHLLNFLDSVNGEVKAVFAMYLKDLNITNKQAKNVKKLSEYMGKLFTSMFRFQFE